VVDPDRAGFGSNVVALGELTGADTATWPGYLTALRSRRASFVAAGATASDHGHPSPVTADLSPAEADDLFLRIMGDMRQPGDAELFRGQMLVEMAAMSLDDGLVLQLHAGAWRDHNPALAARFGPDKGADIPKTVDYVRSLKPLLDRFGNEPALTVVLYTLDETTYSRELAPLAGHYPALRLGPPWWFYDSPEGIRRFYELVIETAGFANTVGFNDDARSLLSIPARHDVARRVNAGYLAGLVAEHRLEEEEAAAIAEDLAADLARRAFGVAP
jgi:glucuronate isomerase